MVTPKALLKIATLVLYFLIANFIFLQAVTLQYSNKTHSNVVPCTDKDRQALLKFKDGVDDPFGSLSSWVGSNCCMWTGVGCRYPTGEVVKLDLGTLSLGGKLSPYLDELEHLRYLNLSYNTFSGMIPLQLGNLSNLRVLDLYLVGDDSYVSDLNWLSGLSFLKFLDLSFLNLSLATSHWLQAINTIPSLVELHLANSNIRTIPLFRSHLNLTSLSVLDLSANNFSTQAPQWLFNISTSAVVLKLSECHFRGPISNFFEAGYDYNLEELSLPFNEFSGELPYSLGRHKSLRTLDLNSNSLSGPLPKSLERLGELKILDLFNNKWEGIVSQDYFQGLSKLKDLSISSSNIGFVLNLSLNWVPPFSLRSINIKNLDLGPKFPKWLQNQTQLEFVGLHNVSISDAIPTWFWKVSPHIQWLDLSFNQISGTIPSSLPVFPPDTSVDLSFNFMHGPIPLFPNVSILYLGNNSFSGTIPANIGQIMPTLILLDLFGNLLTGSIPSSLGKIEGLCALDLSYNMLSGKIHDQWMNPILITIDVSRNNLSGTFPASLCSSPNLLELKLSNNRFSGKLPRSVKNCKSLTLLDLGENKFSGSMPKWIGEIFSLEELRMRGNLFNGSISKQICRFKKLHILDLAQNNLSGTIPTCLSHLNGMKSINHDVSQRSNMDLVLKGAKYTYNRNILKYVIVIDLSCNNLRGFIPNDITNLVGLGTLNLSNNHLTGNIPSKIGDMQNLETLDLSCNHFSGQIPSSMSSLTFLSHLNLSHNNLSGRIPSGNQFHTFDESIYEGNLGLCGSPLPTECESLVVEEKGGNDHDEDEDEKHDDKLGLYVSVALGFVVGFWSICGSLVLKKSWRDAYYGFLSKIKDRIMLVFAMNLNRLQKMVQKERVN